MFLHTWCKVKLESYSYMCMPALVNFPYKITYIVGTCKSTIWLADWLGARLLLISLRNTENQLFIWKRKEKLSASIVSVPIAQEHFSPKHPLYRNMENVDFFCQNKIYLTNVCFLPQCFFQSYYSADLWTSLMKAPCWFALILHHC